MEYSPEVIRSLELWAANQNEPTEPALIVGKIKYTPAQILEEVKSQSDLGLSMYHAMEEGYFDKGTPVY